MRNYNMINTTILIQRDKSLVVTKSRPIYQKENRADTIQFLIDKNIGNMNPFITYTIHGENISGTPFDSTNNLIIKVTPVDIDTLTYNVEVTDVDFTKIYYISRINGRGQAGKNFLRKVI